MIDILVGDCLETLRTLPDASVQCCVTSPPYYNLRNYGVDGQVGAEETPEEYVDHLIQVFNEVRRVLRGDGTLFLNLGDSYANIGHAKGNRGSGISSKGHRASESDYRKAGWGLKNKDRMMMPARVALALQGEGWWLRDEIIWHKPRTTPFPANDRTVCAHEMVYLFAKSERYFFDWAAIEEPAKYAGLVKKRGASLRTHGEQKANLLNGASQEDVGNSKGEEFTVRDTRRSRSVWSISPSPFREGHFATMPPDLVDRCLKAGSRTGDTILDPFGGAGTTSLVAEQEGRNSILCELNPAYVRIAKRRLDLPLTLAERLADLDAALSELQAAMEAA